MHRCTSLLRGATRLDALLALTIGLGIGLGSACTGGEIHGVVGDGGGDGSTNSDASIDSGIRNPPNPLGLGPAPVDLGGPANDQVGSFVVLAKTGITNVTGSSITGGSVGVSPAAATYITGFALSADATNVFSTSPSVVSPGRVFASNFASPTPSNLTTAVLAMQTAYTDAAGRSNPDHLNLMSGNLSGLTLAPGLYKWGSSVVIPSSVTIAGSATDVWIFQISGDLDLSAATQVLMSGGALARNVFWQVAGQTTLHATSHFEGIVFSKTGITMQTGASFHGRLYAQSLVALDDNAITAP